MAYTLSIANRWYVAQESTYGQVPTISSNNRIPAVKLTAQQQRDKSQRKDKTGSRTFAGMPAGMRLQTTFDMTSYMRDWPDPSTLPSHGPLIEAAMGASGVLWGGNAAAAGSTATNITFATPHGLRPGQAVTAGGEIRFVAAVANTQYGGFERAFFSRARVRNSARPDGERTVSRPQLPSVTCSITGIRSTAVQRVLTGAAVDQMSMIYERGFSPVRVQRDGAGYGRQRFVRGRTGGASDVSGGTTQRTAFSYSPVPGNLGEVWLGRGAESVFHGFLGIRPDSRTTWICGRRNLERCCRWRSCRACGRSR